MSSLSCLGLDLEMKLLMVCVNATFGSEMVDWKTLQVVLRLSLVICCCDK